MCGCSILIVKGTCADTCQKGVFPQRQIARALIHTSYVNSIGRTGFSSVRAPRICFSACVMYTLPILYDIYCLMLLKGCFRLLDRCKSLPNLRDYCLNPATASRLGACLFVLTVSVFTQRPLGQNSKTNSIWPISLPIQCFARSHARGYRNRSAAV